MRRTAATAIAHKRVHWTALALRWVVLFALVLDFLTMPLHAHSHDIGPDMSPAALHDAGLPHDDSAVEADDDHDHAVPGAEHHEHHAASGHSVAALWPDNFPDVPDAALTFIVERVRALTLVPLDEPRVASAWRAAPDHVPIPESRYWPPAGRAPPAFHS